MKSSKTIFLFFSLFLIISIFSISATPNQNDWIDNFNMPYYVVELCEELGDSFVGYDYFTVEYLDAGNIVFLNGSYGVDVHFYDYDNYKISLYANNSLCVKNLGDGYQSYHFQPLLLAWDNLGNAVGQEFIVQLSGEDNFSYSPTIISIMPSQLKPFQDIDLGYELSENYDLSDYFVNWDSIIIDYSFNDTNFALEGLKTAVGEGCIGNSRGSIAPSPILACLEGLGNEVYLKIYSTGYSTSNIEFNIQVWNQNGWVFDSFNISTSINPDYSSFEEFDYNQTGTGKSFVGYFVDLMRDIFPNYQELSTSQRYGYVMITMLVFTLLIIFGLYKTNPKIIPYILLIINPVIILYFIAISYISVAVLIIVALILASLTFFKVKSGGV